MNIDALDENVINVLKGYVKEHLTLVTPILYSGLSQGSARAVIDAIDNAVIHDVKRYLEFTLKGVLTDIEVHDILDSVRELPLKQLYKEC
jgi:hypothetical protein